MNNLKLPDFNKLKVLLLTTQDKDHYEDINIYRFRFILKSDKSLQGSLEIVDGPVMFVSISYNVITLGEFGDAYKKVRTDLIEFYKKHIESLCEEEK